MQPFPHHDTQEVGHPAPSTPKTSLRGAAHG